MGQFQMPKELDSENLRKCLDNYEAEKLYIRLKGSCGGDVLVNENLEGRTLDFSMDGDGLDMILDKKRVFHFPLNRYDKGFAVEYERIEPTEDGIGRRIILAIEEDPYDPELPEPEFSVLRSVLDSHLIEISFRGRVHLKYHSMWDKEAGWKYWCIDVPNHDSGDE